VIDTRVRAAARFLQCLWLQVHDSLTASSNAGGAVNGVSAFGNILSPEAAYAGRNFLTPAIHCLARRLD
jgi:hypothetical protein